METTWKKQFTILYAGQAFSLIGSAAVQFAIIWWLTIRTESAVTLAMATIVAMLPLLVLGPFAGVWIDRYNRRDVMIKADLFIALSSAFMGIVFLVDPTPPIAAIYLVLFLRGIGNTFHSPAMQAAIPMLVPPEMLTRAGGWGNLIATVATMAGPVLGAALMGILPIAAIMLVDILGALLAVVCLRLIVIPDIPRSDIPLTVMEDLKLGLAAVRANKPMMAIFLPMALLNVIYMPLGSLFPLLVRTHFQGTAFHNSIVEVFFSGGLLISSLILGTWGGMKRRFRMIFLAILLLGAASAISGALPSALFWAFVICCFFMGFSGSFINIPLMAYTQETIAPEVMGKVFSLIMMVMTLAMPVGLAIAGPVSEAVGIDKWFLWSGVALIATGLLFHQRTRSFDRTDGENPLNRRS